MKINNKLKSDILRQLHSINENSFDETTIKMLLMNIRDYSKGKNLIFEIANFIAHPERDKGLFKERIYSRYYRLERISKEMMNLDLSKADKSKSFDQLIWENRNIEELAIIPKSIFEKIYILALDDFYDELFQRSFGISVNEARAILLSNYRVKDGNYCLLNNEYKRNVLNLIWFISTTVQFRSIIEQPDFIAELNSTIQDLVTKYFDTDEYSNTILAKQNDIMVMILSLLHNIEYYHDRTKIGESFLEINIHDNISLSCTVSVNEKSFQFPIITTSIPANDYTRNLQVAKISGRIPGSFVERQADGKLIIV